MLQVYVPEKILHTCNACMGSIMDLSCKSHDDNSNHLVHQNCTYTLYVHVFRLENRSMFLTCVVGVDRQLSVSATRGRYVCLALFKSVLNVLYFRASH